MDPIHTNIRLMAGVNLDFDLTFIIQLAFVLILMFVLKRLVFNPYLEALDSREAKTTVTRSSADEIRETANARIAAHEDALASARARAMTSKTELRAAGAARKDELLTAARAEANSTVEAAQEQIAGQLETARTELSDEIDTLARSIVTKVIGRQV